MQQLPDIAEILLPERQVEPEFMPEHLVAFGRDTMLAGKRENWVAGQEADESEGADCNADQRRQDQENLVEDISEHGPLSDRTAPCRRRRPRGTRLLGLVDAVEAVDEI